MNGFGRLIIGFLACGLLTSFTPISQADDFSATTNALQQQGFIRQDTGGQVGSGEMALDPFRNSDQLNHGGLFGPLGGPGTQPDPRFGAPPPNARNTGFDVDSDHYMPINRIEHSS